jgi:hypothetical protein
MRSLGKNSRKLRGLKLGDEFMGVRYCILFTFVCVLFYNIVLKEVSSIISVGLVIG